MCFPNLGVRVLGNTPAFACAYYVNACRRAPQRRVRGKELCSCDKSDATRLLQLLWIRSLPCLSSLQANMQSTLEAHVHTRDISPCSTSPCNTITVTRHVLAHPRPPYIHSIATLLLLSHVVRVCVVSRGLVRFDTCVCLIRQVESRPTAEHHYGAVWCLPCTCT